MDDYYNVECNNCGWVGNDGELIASQEDYDSDKDTREIAFNRCPDCDSTDVSGIEED